MIPNYSDIESYDVIDESAYGMVSYAAYATLCRLLNADIDAVSESGQVDAVVSSDEHTVMLPAYFTEIESVDVNTISYAFDVDCVVSTDEERYIKSIRLHSRLMPGQTVTVQGSYGLDGIPDELIPAYLTICKTAYDMQSGDAYVTSKKIEDVSATMTAQSYDTYLRSRLQPYMDIIDKWAIREPGSEYGVIAMPRKHDDLPWYINAADYISTSRI